MLLFLSLFDIFLAIILLYFNARNYKSSIYIGVFFLLIGLYGINHFVVMYSSSVFWVSIFFAHLTVLYYLIGPMSYWYIRSVLCDDSRLHKKDLWHLLPVVIYLAAVIPYFLKPYTYKAEIAAAIVNNRDFMLGYKLTVLSELLSNQLLYLSRPLLVLLYAFGSIFLFFRYKKQKRDTFILLHPNIMENWLLLFIGFQMVLAGSLFGLILKGFADNSSLLFYSVNFLQVLSATGLIGLLVSLFLFPQILYGLPILPSSFSEEMEEASADSLFEIKSSIPVLHCDYIQFILQKTETSMNEDRLFLLSDYNLQKFSDHIQVPIHHLGYFFREFRRQSFNDYRNEWRINYAKSLLKEGKADELTLEAIGLKSGFANRLTFLRAFKKIEGISPSSFLAGFQETE